MARKEKKRYTAIEKKIKSLQDLKDWFKGMKKSNSREAAIELVDIHLDGIKKPFQHVVIKTMDKEEYLLFERFKASKKQFNKWLNEKNKTNEKQNEKKGNLRK